LDQYVPVLISSCICSKLINPDDDILACPFCEEIMHLQCLKVASAGKCNQCKAQVPHELIYPSLGKRRSLLEDKPKEKAEIKEEVKEEVAVNQEIPEVQEIKKRAIIERTEVREKEFPSLKDEKTDFMLQDIIKELKQKN
jgi:hypothetical protein